MQVETSTVILGAFALITSGLTIAGAIVGPVMQSRSRTREKKEEFELARLQKQEDYARQDKVAADLLRRQDEIAAKVERTAQLAAENAKIAGESAIKLEGKIDGVHLLVNSNLTNEKKKTLAVMLEIADLKKSIGKKPTPEFLAEVEALKQELEERKRQDDIVQKEQELSKLKLDTVRTEGERKAATLALVPALSQEAPASALSRDNAQRLDKLEAVPTALTPRPPPPPVPAPSVQVTIEPVKVADDRVAKATERMAEAAEKTASAATETASAATKTAEAATDKKT